MYKHIDLLFKDPINWGLIKTHWQDLLQVVLSIQAGKVSSPVLLRKLVTIAIKIGFTKLFKNWDE
nr:Tn3 family transposase [Nostoc flagelliforme]